MPLILLLALAGLAVVAAGGSSKTAPAAKPGCPVSNAEVTAALAMPDNVGSVAALTALAGRLESCGQTKSSVDVKAKITGITTATGGACPVPAAEINTANALPNTAASLTALGIMATRLQACGQTTDYNKINAKVAAILASLEGGGGLFTIPGGIPGGVPGGLGLAPPAGDWGVPGPGFDPFGILFDSSGAPTPFGASVPGIDALPRPNPHDVIVRAVAYATDPNALKTLSETLRASGYGDAADEVLRAAGMIYAQAAWPESHKLPLTISTYASETYRDRAFRADGAGILDALDYFALVPTPLPDGSVPKFCASTAVGACAAAYDKLLLFQKELIDNGVLGTWTAEIAAAVARLKAELGV